MLQTATTTMAATLKASTKGLDVIVDKARRKKGWTKTEKAWADLATTSKATLRRFWSGIAIQSDTFKAICDAVGVEDWESIVEDELAVVSESKISSKRLSFAIAGSIEEIDKHKLDAIVALLNKLGGDTSIEILDIDEGSVKLILGGSLEALERIENLFKSGQIEEIAVRDVHFLRKDELVQLVRKNGSSSGTNLSRTDLSGVDLSGVDLSGADLSGADLSGADLSGADLSGADLSEANLSRTDLSGVDLSGADLSGVDLSGADLSRADLSRLNLRDADLSGVMFRLASLQWAELNGAILNGADLAKANLSFADLSGASLLRAQLRSVNLTEANLEGCCLRNALLNRAKLNKAKLSRAILSGAQLVGAFLNAAQLENADLSQANLAMSELCGANLTNADLSNTNLNGANLHKTSLNGVRANGAQMATAILTQASLKDASLVRANLRDANLTEANLSGAQLNRAYLVSCCLDNAQMNDVDLAGAYMLGARLNNANLRDALLVRTYLSHATLNSVDLRNAEVSGANLTSVNMETVANVVGARFAKNQGLSSGMKTQLRERGALLFPSPQWAQIPEEEIFFETTRRLHEARIDFSYRYLDLDEATNAIQDSLKHTEESLQDAARLEVITEAQFDTTNQFIVLLRQDLQRFISEIESLKLSTQNIFENMSADLLREWLDGALSDELETIHQACLDLAKHNRLIVSVWRSITEIEEIPNYVR